MRPHHRPERFRAAIGFALALALALTPRAALGHAELGTHEPADDATVVGTPTVIEAAYNETLDPSGSNLVLVDAGGTKLAQGGVADDATPTKEMSISPVPELAPGAYEVRSTTKSADDGDIDRKVWGFTVVAPSPTPAPNASVTPSIGPPSSGSAAASASTTTPATPEPSGDTASPTSSGGDVVLPIIVALALVAGVGGYLLVRRRPTGNG